MSGAPVVVAVDGPGTPAWQARALELIEASDVLELAGVRVEPAPRGGRAWALHRRIERRIFRLGPDALAPVALEAREPAGDPEPDRPALTVWLAAAPPPPGDDTLRVGHGPAFEPAEPAFRRALASGSDAVRTEVRRGHRVISSSISGVRAYSATLSTDAALWKAAALVARAAETAAAEPATTPTTKGDAAPPPSPPGAGFAARSAGRWGRALGTRFLYRRPWRIAVRERSDDPARGWDELVEVVRFAPGHVYADPFLFERGGAHHLFFEHVPAGQTRGVIAHAELRPGEAAEPVTVMEAPHHLSYPHVFEHGGEVFLLPESSAARRLELHRATEFPHRWELDTVLFDDLDVVDATPFEHEGRLWMLAAIAAHGASRLDELHLLWADGPRGPWTPHPLNPVVSDARAGRPAGAMLRDGDRLIRPAQDGSRRYGGAVSFRAVDVLSETEYEEHEVGRIDPADMPGARAVHAYARDSRYEAIDFRVREPRWGRRSPSSSRSIGPGSTNTSS